MTTKAEERAILRKIEKLIEQAGQDSYIAAAFEGCVSLAAENIENDFTLSPKERLESMTALYEKTSLSLDKANAEINILNHNIEDLFNAHAEKVDNLRRERDEALALTLSPDLYKSLYCLVTDEINREQTAIESNADILATLCDTPTDIAFTAAAKNIKRAKARREELAIMLKNLEQIEPKNL